MSGGCSLLRASGGGLHRTVALVCLAPCRLLSVDVCVAGVLVCSGHWCVQVSAVVTEQAHGHRTCCTDVQGMCGSTCVSVE